MVGSPTLRAAWAAVVLVIAVGGCGGRSESPSPTGSSSPLPSDVVQITGFERFGWTQASDDIQALHFAVYVDDLREELPLAVCRASGRAYACDSPLPELTAGLHTLETVSWIAGVNHAIESPRAAPLRVMVTGTGNLSASTTSSVKTSAALGAKPEAGCGFALESDRRFFLWNDRGEIQSVDRGRHVSTPLTWQSAPDDGWVLSGIALHPDFAGNHWMYISELQSSGRVPRIRLSRYRAVADVLGERAVLVESPLSALPARTRLTFGADRHLYVALLSSSDPASPATDDHLFLIRVDESGHVPDDNAGRSIFDRATATAPVAVAWGEAPREPWVAEWMRPGVYQLKRATLETRARRPFDAATPPVAMQIVHARDGARLLVFDRAGDVASMALVNGDWTVRGRTRLTPALVSVDDGVAFRDGELAVCGASADGRYGMSRGRPAL